MYNRPKDFDPTLHSKTLALIGECATNRPRPGILHEKFAVSSDAVSIESCRLERPIQDNKLDPSTAQRAVLLVQTRCGFYEQSGSVDSIPIPCGHQVNCMEDIRSQLGLMRSLLSTVRKSVLSSRILVSDNAVQVVGALVRSSHRTLSSRVHALDFGRLRGNLENAKVQLEEQRSSFARTLSEVQDYIVRETSRVLLENDLRYKEELELVRSKLRDEISVRRKLHNLVMELKGNIRVFARIRPQSQAELSNGAPACVSSESDTELIINRGNQSRKFTFDRVFDCATANNEVFTDIQQLLVSTLDGFNVCVLTYGITGSGKTFTMQGIFERVGIDLFEQKVSRERSGGWKYLLELAVYEIYNETVIDLLNLKNIDTNPRISSSTGYFHIPGITSVSVESPGEIQKLLQDSSRNRSVSSTNCNEQSSRSHLIVTIFVDIVTPNNKEIRSKLTLVDLAGSERLDKSGASGQTAKEAVHINKSLSALGDVISARVNKASHVPYRNSMLTTVLQECLVGDAKTLMILQIHPAIHAVEETMNSLIFASRVREVETFKPLNSPRRR